ncbi:hypothetical protein KSH70_027090, partial [Escherichia coli]|nr:hypothetical protein [Escherichia coli]
SNWIIVLINNHAPVIISQRHDASASIDVRLCGVTSVKVKKRCAVSVVFFLHESVCYKNITKLLREYTMMSPLPLSLIHMYEPT